MDQEVVNSKKNGSSIVVYIITAIIGVCLIGLIIFLNAYLKNDINPEFTLTLTHSENDETTILEGEENVITPEQIELEFTYKDLQEHEIFANAVSKMPSIGESKILVLPIIIPGYPLSSAQQEQTKQDIYNVFFGDASDTYWESVSSFYYESSFEQLNITGDVMPWYSASHAGYNSVNTINSTVAIMNIIDSALEYHISAGNVNVDDFDEDGDGYIDGLWVIYSAPDYLKNTSLSSTYWAFTTWWYDPDDDYAVNDYYSVYAWASLYQIYYDVNSNNYMTNNFSSWELDSHTLVHETGHILGLNDYYDYNEDVTAVSAPAGFSDMMDFNICDHNMYSKMTLGWVKPYIVTGDATIELASNQVKNSLIVLLDSSSPALTSNGDGTYTFNPFYEYIMVEYYVPEGLNEQDSFNTYTTGVYGISGEGFKVYHIDNRLFALDRYWRLSEYTGQSYYGLYYFISNTTGGEYAENATLDDYGLTFSDGTTIDDYFAEVSLISSNVNEPYNYKKSYTYYDYDSEGGSLYYCLAKTSDLFTSGSQFDMSTYSKYFIYGDSNKFNNGHIFNSTIVFS